MLIEQTKKIHTKTLVQGKPPKDKPQSRAWCPPRHGAPVTADVEVVARLGGDEAEVLALSFGALAHAPGHGGLELVGRPEPCDGCIGKGAYGGW